MFMELNLFFYVYFRDRLKVIKNNISLKLNDFNVFITGK